ncbi:MAG: lipoyl synthase, partial [Myxococcota bacterium]
MNRALPILQDATGKSLGPTRRKPEWLKIRPPGGGHYNVLKERARRLKLATVCEEAHCPNISECWSGGTATFMLMGDTCTRGCRFCAINTAKRPPALDAEEPAAIAEAVKEMGLSYVVLTSVNRDELDDGGAGHLRECLDAIHASTPNVLIEILIPDFEGKQPSIRQIAESNIAVLAHNVETVRRLTAQVRDRRADYQQSLDVLAYSKEVRPNLLTKTSLMLGLGESEEEVIECMHDLRKVD